MKAVVFPAAESIALEQVPDPTPAEDEIVVKIARSGICGTDLHIYRNEYMSNFPLIPGHEFGGTIVELGKKVTGYSIGERVAVDPNLYCGYCDFCRNEQSNHCANWQGIGITRSGGFAEYVNVPVKAAYRLPDSLSDQQAAFIEPLACVVYALKRLHIRPADRVLLLGSGPMGLLLIQALRAGNASRITVVDKQPGRLELAKTLGANQTVLAGADQAAELKALAPYGFDIVIDATGVPAVIENAFQHLKVRGQFLQFGVTPNNARVSINPYDIFHNDWTIIGSFALCYTFLPAIAWLESGAIDVSSLVSHTIPLADFAEAFHQFAAGETLKVHLQIGS
ncbi:MAG TPA: zinc-dependent alcohol dehydrogenase family protein [Phototrophicaceae bacterium]|jgi:2-desacetyl-2-hydroxyethyl bacteriochlorophyllide A dehydrogenase|nr:zinc-dependent alcohol dehydrogenase family protein [Phototrophicaceae bacterium]